LTVEMTDRFFASLPKNSLQKHEFCPQIDQIEQQDRLSVYNCFIWHKTLTGSHISSLPIIFFSQ
jgi:hypothetical protein